MANDHSFLSEDIEYVVRRPDEVSGIENSQSELLDTSLEKFVEQQGISI
jgi:hypothetical protein